MSRRLGRACPQHFMRTMLRLITHRLRYVAKFMIDTCYIDTLIVCYIVTLIIVHDRYIVTLLPSNGKLAMRSSFCPKRLFSLFYVLFLLQKLALPIPTGKQLLIYFACSFILITQILLRDSQSLLFGRTMITQFKTTMSKVSS